MGGGVQKYQNKDYLITGDQRLNMKVGTVGKPLGQDRYRSCSLIMDPLFFKYNEIVIVCENSRFFIRKSDHIGKSKYNVSKFRGL